jgi:Cdc6-like AAA superfamily ATPase
MAIFTRNKCQLYLLSETDQPLVICGETGTGKSAIIAKIASDVNIAIKNEDLAMRTALVFRFVGQTQKAVTAQELLYSL